MQQAAMAWQESELVSARLERSQAEAKAQRAQQRLDDFLAQQAAPQVRLMTHHPLECMKIPLQRNSLRRFFSNS